MKDTGFYMRCSNKTLSMIEQLAVEFDMSNSALVRMLVKNAYDKEFFNKTNV